MDKIFMEVYLEIKDHKDFVGDVETVKECWESFWYFVRQSFKCTLIPKIIIPGLGHFEINAYKAKVFLRKIDEGTAFTHYSFEKLLKLYLNLQFAYKVFSNKFINKKNYDRFSKRNTEVTTLTFREYIERSRPKLPELLIKSRERNIEALKDKLLQCPPPDFLQKEGHEIEVLDRLQCRTQHLDDITFCRLSVGWRSMPDWHNRYGHKYDIQARSWRYINAKTRKNRNKLQS